MGTSTEASKRKPRVLFINTRSALGADVAVHLTLIQNFDPNKIDVHIATNRNSTDLGATLEQLKSVPDLKLVVCDLGYELSGGGSGKIRKLISAAKNFGAAVSLVRLAWYIRKNKIDILHSTDRPRDAAFSTILARLAGCKNVIHVHIKWYPEIGRATTWAAAHCTSVLAISQFTRQSLIDGGISPAKIGTVLNATDTVKFDPAKTSRGLLRKKIGLDNDAPLIGLVARIMVWKGHLELVESMVMVCKLRPDAHLAIVGKVDLLAAQGSDSFVTAVQKRIEELGLQQNIHWAGWIDAMPEVMADLDILAVPSWEEPFGLVVTEGMAMERPVVGFCSGALPEIISSGEDGILVKQKDVSELANALLLLLDNPEMRYEMGRKARQTVILKFTPQRQADEVVEYYSKLIKNQSPNPA